MPPTEGDGPTDERERLRQEVARLEAALEREREHAEQWRTVAEERRVQLEKLRQHPVIALLFRVSRIVLPGARRWVKRLRGIYRRLRGLGARVKAVRHQLDARSRERSLERAVRELGDPPAVTRPVSVIVLTRDGRERLETLLPALRRVEGVPDLEVVVVDNGSGPETVSWLAGLHEGEYASGAPRHDVRVVRNDTNLSFSEANGRGVAASSGEVLCFLNDDVEPLEPGWLARMVARLGVDGNVAVGAQLVYPRRPLFTSRTRDVGVQHRGIGFRPVPGGVPQATNLGHGQDPSVVAETAEVAAATAACLVVERAAFEQVGGFDGRYDYGAEDVDLCWRLRQATGGRVVVAMDAVLYHREGATRHREDAAVLERRQTRNWDLLAERFGPALARAVALDRLEGRRTLSPEPYRVAITLTRDVADAGYGDWFTGHELGDALERLGWEVVYVERYRDAWYDLPADVDALVVLHDLFDVRRVDRPGLVTIAWIRNWVDRWMSHPWFEDYDLVLASSQHACDLVAERTRHRPRVFPIATNPRRFRPRDRDRSGVVFTGNHWGQGDRIGDLLDAVPDLVVHGKGWDEVPGVADRWRGQLDYDDLNDVYASSLLVLDQSPPATRQYGSVNSRVFDALAAGALVVTDQRIGSEELFDGELPTYDGPEQLEAVVGRFRSDPERARELAERLRQRVLASHTYDRRAEQLRDLLVERTLRPSFALATSVPDRKVADTWGDWHLARALAAELRVRGHEVGVLTAEEWEARASRRFDVFVHLKGRSVAPRAEGQFHVVWNISHPEELTPEECDAADLVLVASHTGFDRELSARTSTPVGVLLQATDERRFRPRPVDPRYAHDVCFLGNSRFQLRPIVRDALAAGLDLVVYGANWEKWLEPDAIRATHVDNAEVPVVYSSVKVLLNDHWEGMRRHGFASNRLFDALACGAVVVSDDLPGLDELFDGAVATYHEVDDLGATVRRLLGAPEQRAERSRRGRAAVLAAHTFAHRADQLLAHVRENSEKTPHASSSRSFRGGGGR